MSGLRRGGRDAVPLSMASMEMLCSCEEHRHRERRGGVRENKVWEDGELSEHWNGNVVGDGGVIGLL